MTSTSNLRSIGPVTVDYRRPQMSWGAEPVGPLSPVSISGLISWPQAKQLRELVANRERAVTVGGATGALEYVVLDGDLVGDFAGWYLLQSFQIGVEHDFSVQGATGPTPFTLSAVYLSNHLSAAVVRSARARPNDLSLAATAIVSDPFGRDSAVINPFATSPGGNLAHRSFDSNAYTLAGTPSVRSLGLYAGLVSAGGSELQPIVIPAGQAPETFGADCRAYDRRDEREVYGPGHPFARPTDLLITNGLVRCWPGPVGVPAYLHVAAMYPSAWADVGCLQLAEQDELLAVRLDAVRPDEITMTVLIRDQGEVTVTLHRGERMLRIRHGGDRQPIVSVPRTVGWLGMPPTRQLAGMANGTGRYGRGLTTSGVVEWSWPGQRDAWATAGNWLPTAASSTQVDSGLLTLVAATGDTSRLRWDAATKTVKWDHNGSTLTTTALTFAASAPVSWAIGYDGTTAHLVVRVGSTTDVASIAAGPGTTAANWTSMLVGVATGGFGTGTFGSGTFGGAAATSALGGVLDNLMAFDGPLTDVEATNLLASATALGGLPTPEGRLVWYAPLNADVKPLGSTMTAGRRYQATAELGATRSPDANGLTKGLCVLRSVATARTPFAAQLSGTTFEVGAFLATTATQDDLANHHEQFAATSEQEVRVR